MSAALIILGAGALGGPSRQRREPDLPPVDVPQAVRLHHPLRPLLPAHLPGLGRDAGAASGCDAQNSPQQWCEGARPGIRHKVASKMVIIGESTKGIIRVKLTYRPLQVCQPNGRSMYK